MASPPRTAPPFSSPRVPLARGDVHVWCTVPVEAREPGLLAAYRSLLTSEEHRRYAAFQVEDARLQYLVTRALVRTALSHHEHRPPAAWRFRANGHGRPEIDGPSDLRFSASNCQGLVVCAVGKDLELGVDAEPLSSAPAILGLMSRVCSPPEIAALEALPEPQRADRALSLWTLKEAYAKARGTGLSLPLRSVSFELGSPDIVLREDATARDAHRFRFQLLDVEGHRLAVARGGEVARLSVWRAVPLAGFERCSPGGPSHRP